MGLFRFGIVPLPSVRLIFIHWLCILGMGSDNLVFAQPLLCLSIDSEEDCSS